MSTSSCGQRSPGRKSPYPLALWGLRSMARSMSMSPSNLVIACNSALSAMEKWHGLYSIDSTFRWPRAVGLKDGRGGLGV